MKYIFVSILLIAVASATMQDFFLQEDIQQDLRRQRPQGRPKRFSLGDAMTHSHGDFFKLPTTTEEAKAMGYAPVNGDRCKWALGVLWAQSGGISPKQSVGVFFTPAGQIAGIQQNIYGRDKGGPAGRDNLVRRGFWIRNAEGVDAWHINVSFRRRSHTCSKRMLRATVGNRVVINQHLGGAGSYYVPTTDEMARKRRFEAGTCFPGMGQHWMRDITCKKQTWNSGNLMPLVPMYHVVGEKKGQISAFFIPVPVCQTELVNDWDAPPPGLCGLPTTPNFCLNYCNDECQWDNEFTNTEHFYFDAAPGENYKCENPVSKEKAAEAGRPLLGEFGGECPNNTKSPLNGQ